MSTYYELECTDCPFHTTVIGDYADVIEEINAHRTEHEAGPTEHFVNVHDRK